MRKRHLVAALVLIFSLLPVAAVQAEDPPSLNSPVIDTTGLTDSGTIGDALERLRSGGNIRLYEVYVGTTAPLDIDTFVQETVTRNNLAERDGLFVVAVGDMTYELWLGPEVAATVSESEQSRVLVDAEKRLSAGDYTGAGVTTADGVRSAAGDSSGFDGSILSMLIPIGLTAVAAGGVLWLLIRQRQHHEEATAPSSDC